MISLRISLFIISLFATCLMSIPPHITAKIFVLMSACSSACETYTLSDIVSIPWSQPCLFANQYHQRLVSLIHKSHIVWVCYSAWVLLNDVVWQASNHRMWTIFSNICLKIVTHFVFPVVVIFQSRFLVSISFDAHQAQSSVCMCVGSQNHFHDLILKTLQMDKFIFWFLDRKTRITTTMHGLKFEKKKKENKLVVY